MKKRSIPWIVSIILVVVLIGGGFWYYKAKNAKAASNSSFITGVVRSATVTKKINATGTIQIPTQYNLSFNGKSKITQVNVAAGDSVKAGQVLAQLDDTVANQQILQAKTTLSQKQAQLSQLKAGATQVEIITAQNELTRAQNSLLNAQMIRDAVKNAPTLEAARQYDQSLGPLYTTLDAAIQKEQRAVDSAQTEVNLAQAKLDAKKAGASSTDLQTAQASVDQANSSLAIAQAALSDYVLVAPADGVIAAVNGKAGEYPGSGSSGGTSSSSSSSAFIVLEASSPDVQINVPADEADIASVKVDQSVNITLPAYPDKKFSGTVTKVSTIGKTQNNVTTFEVTVTAANTDSLMKAGMSANVSIIIAQKQNVLTVPSEALRGSGNQKWVMLPPAAGSSQTGRREVQIGLDDGSNAEVLSGLQAGEQIIVGVRAASVQQNSSGNPFGAMGGAGNAFRGTGGSAGGNNRGTAGATGR